MMFINKIVFRVNSHDFTPDLYMFLTRSRRQHKRYLKWVFVCNLLAFIIGIFYLSHQRYVERKAKKALQLGRLIKYEETRNDDGMVMDTYFRRINQFLTKRNISIQSYERAEAIDAELLTQIQQEIVYLQRIEQQELSNISHGVELEKGCKQKCCWSVKRMRNFYNGEQDRIPGVLDRLSSIDLKLLADVHYGTLRIPVGIQLPKLTYDILPCLQNGTIIFVDTIDLIHFFRDFHEKIMVNYILMTGDSDFSCPLHIIRSHYHLLDRIFTGQTRILHWFSMNCNLGPHDKWHKSNRFTCIPQGISQWLNQRYYMQLASGKDDSIRNRHLKSDDYWILTSFNKNNGLHRKEIWNFACHGRLRNISKCFYRLDSVDQWRYYLHIARSKFVLSPPGDGIDCYRTWEALYLGSIPIILKTTINSIFEQLPVLIVNNYEEITLELLTDVYEKMIRQSYDNRRLYKGYWQNRIHSIRNSSRTVKIYYTSLKS